jgi:hypothetical protein
LAGRAAQIAPGGNTRSEPVAKALQAPPAGAPAKYGKRIVRGARLQAPQQRQGICALAAAWEPGRGAVDDWPDRSSRSVGRGEEGARATWRGAAERKCASCPMKANRLASLLARGGRKRGDRARGRQKVVDKGIVIDIVLLHKFSSYK